MRHFIVILVLIAGSALAREASERPLGELIHELEGRSQELFRDLTLIRIEKQMEAYLTETKSMNKSDPEYQSQMKARLEMWKKADTKQMQASNCYNSLKNAGVDDGKDVMEVEPKNVVRMTESLFSEIKNQMEKVKDPFHIQEILGAGQNAEDYPDCERAFRGSNTALNEARKNIGSHIASLKAKAFDRSPASE